MALPSPVTLPDIIAAAARGEVTLLDVREASELRDTGTAAGAMHIPLGQLPLQAGPGAPEAKALAAKPIAVFCAAGARAGRAVEFLTGLGYEAVNIGGFGQWVEAGGPVRRF